MATEAKVKTPRKTPPLCRTCHHPQSFHEGGKGKCRSIGCKTCEQFVPRPSQAA